MSISLPSVPIAKINKRLAGSTAGEFLWHDTVQIRRLHEPVSRIGNIDPMTGDDILDFSNHPSVKDGNLTMYFQTDDTRKVYIEMPLNHPSSHQPFAAKDDDDRGG